MSAKNLDSKGRLRSRVVGFRMSESEAKELNLKVAASGMNKQDYIIESLLKRNIRIVGGRKVIREVQMQLEAILEELQFMDENTDIDEDVIMPLKVVLEVLTADEAKK
ncbi:MAG: hypothetical protein IKQ63_00805 [Eubacterium sp.]|jgi:hypothetical protein|nr:hypothetical protein [Eubacterium sp.]